MADIKVMVPQRAILAGGCFWGMEELIRALPGVVDTTVGYSGGSFKNPTYDDVKKGNTGHAEAIKVTFDPSVLSYHALLEFFFQIHDPSTRDRQGNDIGASYRSAIFYDDEGQKQVADHLIAELNAAKIYPGPIVTELAPATEFYAAEGYHQDYLQHYPQGYTCHYIRPAWKIAA
jgi:peptide-methionine (S)-S-oxide reductase